MVIKVVLLTLVLVQIIYLLIKVKNSKEKKHYIPALLVSVITGWSIYKSFTMYGFAAVYTIIFSAFGLLVLFVFTKHPPFLKEKN
ncbi:hypothetical protein LF817_17080 [Halobacillus sp. A1]|uniref:hypothetical protein n=1 Tax=Halobacillus sp. A1 TaxID=2880262 RepID=UPI0020A6B406|nr:hypothetical protein [Halobacillus sp. A1]MCP3033040.1 hypothetical protein [Halobacillus sp. A1]